MPALTRKNPATNIADSEKVEIVLKDGVGYDSEKLIQSVQGLVGIRCGRLPSCVKGGVVSVQQRSAIQSQILRA